LVRPTSDLFIVTRCQTESGSYYTSNLERVSTNPKIAFNFLEVQGRQIGKRPRVLDSWAFAKSKLLGVEIICEISVLNDLPKYQLNREPTLAFMERNAYQILNIFQSSKSKHKCEGKLIAVKWLQPHDDSAVVDSEWFFILECFIFLFLNKLTMFLAPKIFNRLFNSK